MRIVISGTHASGKSTLIADFALRPPISLCCPSHSISWQIVKSFETTTMRGRRPSADWRFQVDYLERTEEPLPVDGIPYAAVLTIADPKRRAPVFTQMRQSLNAIGVRTDDLRTSIRTRATT